MNEVVVAGKRKTAIAKATIKEGNGKVTINRRPVSFLPLLRQLEIKEPLLIAKKVLGKLNFDVSINVKGGGSSAQIDASRLALAKAIVLFTKNKKIRSAFLAYDRNLLVADTRRKEACKPGDSKARAMRQTSYR
ncbi:30S ribosomal protein S9 [Candidatus Pacearchaeota archaeon]|nr:MAG: 30S ribosomal protein S9 [Candidatus Pacearchaeota archaeon]